MCFIYPVYVESTYYTFLHQDPSKKTSRSRNQSSKKSSARSCQDEQSKQRKHWDNMGAPVGRFVSFPKE